MGYQNRLHPFEGCDAFLIGLIAPHGSQRIGSSRSPGRIGVLTRPCDRGDRKAGVAVAFDASPEVLASSGEALFSAKVFQKLGGISQLVLPEFRLVVQEIGLPPDCDSIVCGPDDDGPADHG